jgi:hypothetical protein
MPWWQKLTGCNSTDDDGRSEDERAPLIEKAPTVEEMTIVSTVCEVASSRLMLPCADHLCYVRQRKKNHGAGRPGDQAD